MPPSVPNSHLEFVSEPIEPLTASSDISARSRGEPGLPSRFIWRKTTYEVASVLSTWKSSTRDRGDLYLRRHWFEIQTTSGLRMKLYCERQAKNRAKPKARWWLYAVSQVDQHPIES